MKHLLLAFAALFALGTCQPRRLPDVRTKLAKLSASSEVRLYSIRGNPGEKTIRLGEYPELLECLRAANFAEVGTRKINSNTLLEDYGLTSSEGNWTILSYPLFAPLDLEIPREIMHEVDIYRASDPLLRVALDKVMVQEFGKEGLSPGKW